MTLEIGNLTKDSVDSEKEWFRHWWLERAAVDGSKYIPPSSHRGDFTEYGLAMRVLYSLIEEGWFLSPPPKLEDPEDEPIETPAWLQEMIELRKSARESKNYKEADRIRDELRNKGYVLMDYEGGRTEWAVSSLGIQNVR